MYSACIYTLLKVVSYYDLSVLFMSVIGFQKMLMGLGGRGELYPVLVWIFGIFKLKLQSFSTCDTACCVSFVTAMRYSSSRQCGIKVSGNSSCRF